MNKNYLKYIQEIEYMEVVINNKEGLTLLGFSLLF